MAYTLNKFNGVELVVLEDGTIDTSTSLGLVGRNYVGYGETQNENFIFLLENFANDFAPARPLQGQTWFNNDNNLLHVYNGTTWQIVGAAVLSLTPPEDPSVGELWLRTTDNTLHTWIGTSWVFIGPEAVAGFGPTRARSTSLIDSDGGVNPVIQLTINGTVIGICTSRAFTIAPSNSIPGFNNLVAGVTMSSLTKFSGDVEGNATSATRLETSRTINGVAFNGTQNITIRSSTSNSLKRGDYILGSDFDGSAERTWAVDASSSNLIGKVVARDSAGNFSAGTITANLVGTLQGNVNINTGDSFFNIIHANQVIGPVLSGNADTTTRLQTGRNINGVLFDGTQNITVTAAAGTLTGTAINPTVISSNLQAVGVLNSLTVADTGIVLGSGNQLRIFLDTGSVPTIKSQESNKKLKFTLSDSTQSGAVTDISFIASSESLALGGLNAPALIPDTENNTNLGHPTAKWNNIYANNLVGNADTATLATTSTNLAGGGAGSLPYQVGGGITTMLPSGTPGQILKASAGNTLIWADPTFEGLTPGDYLALKRTDNDAPLSEYSTTIPTTIYVDATTTNTANKVVVRDSNGDFAARQITAALIGNANTATLAARATEADHATTADTATTATTATNALYSTTRTPFDGSTRVATTAYVDNMYNLLKPAKLVVSDPTPNLVTPSPQYRDLINAYIPASAVTVGTQFEFIVNVIYASTTTSVSGSQWISAYQWGTLSVAASTNLYDSYTGFKLIYTSNGSTWNYTGTWSYV